jgi:hypothetical protein
MRPYIRPLSRKTATALNHATRMMRITRSRMRDFQVDESGAARMRIGRDTTYNLEFSLPNLPDLLRSSTGLQISNPASGRESVRSSVSPRLCASHANNAVTHSRMRPAASQREIKRAPWTPKEDAKLRKMQRDGYSWDDIHAALPGRSKGAIQVRYSTKFKCRYRWKGGAARTWLLIRRTGLQYHCCHNKSGFNLRRPGTTA